MKIIHLADLHLGVENYGHLNPESGLSTRLEDFLRAFDRVVDYALENEVDLVIFCGDAYKSREPTQTQQRELAKRINRLATNDIPVFLLTGNHDLPNAIGRATALEIFDTLAVRNVYVSNKPQVHRITTRSGVVQVASLPWLRRSALLSREETKDLDFERINQKLQQVLTDIISAQVAQLAPGLPAILAAHVWVAGAKVGSEKSMTIGQEHALLLSNIANPAFDYVALGHIHRAQTLTKSPPVVYAGSLERVDFSEENDDKGFYVVEIGQGDPSASSVRGDSAEPGQGKRPVAFEFHKVEGRRFVTLDVNIESSDSDPTGTILQAIQSANVKDAIVRLQVSLPSSIAQQLRDNEIRNALKEAHFFTIAKDVRREARLRLGERATEEITPLEALKAYLESTREPPERVKLLLEYGERLMEEGQGE
ncbi:MAG: exonuclease SbcCD subunit D [Chloroflexi bacterium]|nr:exonuclease SbcCD subunit D [Chloroflexota bacterium]